MRGRRRLLGVAAAVMAMASASCAPGRSTTVLAGPAYGSTRVARKSGDGVGVSLGASLLAPEEGVGLTGLVQLQPFAVHNPVREEEYRLGLVMPALQLGGVRQGFFVRLGLGAGIFNFTGEDCVCGADLGVAAGAGLGVVPTAGSRVSVEAFLGTASTSDFELGATMFSLQLGWRVGR